VTLAHTKTSKRISCIGQTTHVQSTSDIDTGEDWIGSWPLHDIVITNMVWCMTYTRKVKGELYTAR